jgi:acyl-CoA synthetase (NDP forming)
MASRCPRIGLPVVLKIVSPDILHKTEAGGVLVGLSSAEEVSAGFETILRNAKAYDPDADITGVQVQQMQEYRDRGIDKPIVASLAGDVEVEQASEYLFDHGIPAYPYTTETPVEVLAAKYRWARLAGFIDGQPS